MIRKTTILALVMLLILVGAVAWLAWQAVTWLAQGDNAFIAYVAAVLSIMFVAGLRDDAREWR